MVRRLAPVLLASCFGALGAGPVRAVAEEAPEVAARPARLRLTSLDSGPLARTDAVVLGNLRVLVPAGRMAPQVARVDVEAVLYGTAASTFTLFIGGPKNTLNRQQPSVDYLEGRSSGRYVLFLARSPAGSGFEMVTLFLAEDALGREKADVMTKELALAALTDVEERARRTLSHLLDLLGASTSWSRQHAAGELMVLSEARPALFDAAVRTELNALRRRVHDPVVRARLDRVLGAVAAGPLAQAPQPPAGAGTGAPAPELAAGAEFLRARRRLADPLEESARIAALAEVARLGKGLAGPDLAASMEGAEEAAVRERAAVLLGDVGAREFLPRVLEAYDRERDPVVREALVRAAGLLGDASTVAWVLARAGEAGLLRPACFALARLRTEEALVRLEELRVAALSKTPTDEGTAKLVVYLRSAAFVDAERVAGRSVGPRAAAPGPGSGVGAGLAPPKAPEGDGPR